MQFADKLIALRKARGLTQEDLASKLNVSRQAIGKWESGQSLPETDKIPSIGDYFGVTTDYLLTDKEDNAEQSKVHVQLNPTSKSKSFFTGLVLLFLGTLTDLVVIVAAAINLPSINAWSTSYPSKLWFLIVSGMSQYNDGADGLGLGWVFVLGIVAIIVGILLLILDSFRRKKK